MLDKNRKATASILLLAVQLVLLPMARAGDLEPSAAPAPTMHTLEDIYGKLEAIDGKIEVCADCPPAPVRATGQTRVNVHGDDGDHRQGVVSPGPRFNDNQDGTVKDNLTGLVWLKNAGCFGPTNRNMSEALILSNTLNSGECGLADGSVEGDWRLPNRFEMESLLDLGQLSPALPSGHPFTGVMEWYYVTSTKSKDGIANASGWSVYIYDGRVIWGLQGRVWPVRGGSN